MSEHDRTRTIAGGPPNPGQRRALATVSTLLESLEVGGLVVELPDGRRRSFGEPGASCATVTVHDWRFFPRLLDGASVGLGTTYMDGLWSCADLVALVHVLIANRDALRTLRPGALVGIASDVAVHALRGNRIGRAKRNISAHYDLSNELYELFLDDTMTYSSAYFPSPTTTLEDAQREKYARLVTKARLAPEHHVLEVGCGWGGFAVHAARTVGCRVTAITLSERQAAYAEERVHREGLDELVDVRVIDYREVEGRYDRIVSIEMLEAVGHRYLSTYFAALDRLLAPDGIAAIQVITIPEQRYDAYRRRPDFVQRVIFPGGHLPSLEAMCAAMGTASTLYVHEVENIGMHYAETLRRWRARFLERESAVRSLGFDDRFVRMWEFYLAYCEAAFATRYIGDLQLVLARPLNRSLGAGPYERGSEGT